MEPRGINDGPVPVRATYSNINKWPESDAEFIKSRIGGSGEPQVVGGFSRRQLYLRSYTFSTEKDYTVYRRLGRFSDKIKRFGGGRRKRSTGFIFRWLLSCTNKIRVVE